MKAIAERSTEHAALLEEYREALHEWTKARSLNPLYDQAPEVLKATGRVEELERKLKHLREQGQ